MEETHMEHKLYGYIRVSTREQNEERQVRAMEEFGVLPANMICDKQSGKDFERSMYKRLLRKLTKMPDFCKAGFFAERCTFL